MVSQQLQKPEFECELWSALSNVGVLPPQTSSPFKEQTLTEMLRLKELELEMRRLDLNDKELDNDYRFVKWKRRLKDNSK